MTNNQGSGPMPQVPRPARSNIQPKQIPAVHSYNGDFDKQPVRTLILSEQPEKAPEKPVRLGCVFAKSCNLPDGVIDYPGNVTPELLNNYGDWAVMSTGVAIQTGGTRLQLIGSSSTATAIASRLGGTLALGLIEGAATMMAGAGVGTIAMLLPNTTSADSAFYTKEQYYSLGLGRTRVRVHIQQLSAGTINVYGFYTGRKREWEHATVVKASARGEQFVADLGQGIELIWTPAADSQELGIPALTGSPQLPTVWVYPPTEQADKVLVNPVHPPDYQDAIIWFPNAGMQPIYIALSLPGDHGYHPKPASLPAFPGLRWARPKTAKKGGGLRDRWKDEDGTIYEWDSQHGALEKYNKRGKHLGEFDPQTGLQTKPADKSREIEP